MEELKRETSRLIQSTPAQDSKEEVLRKLSEAIARCPMRSIVESVKNMWGEKDD